MTPQQEARFTLLINKINNTHLSAKERREYDILCDQYYDEEEYRQRAGSDERDPSDYPAYIADQRHY